MDYDYDYPSDFEEDINNVINNFLYHKTDDVIDLYESIKQRFHMSSPFFLSYTNYVINFKTFYL